MAGLDGAVPSSLLGSNASKEACVQESEQPRLPKISCLMVTRGNLFPTRFAVDCYRRQTYPNRELVIVCDRPDSELAPWVAQLRDETIRYVETGPAILGALRNISVAAAEGELVCQWDDDDLYHPRRLEKQAAVLAKTGHGAHFLSQWMLWWPARRRLGISNIRPWEGSMLARRDLLPAYPELARREDKLLVTTLSEKHPISVTSMPALYCYVIHGNNTWHEAHFEEIWRYAEKKVRPEAYDAQLGQLAGKIPIREYAEALAGQASIAS
jgi:glycosyltransferase involved in cell wall biosynthesis